MKFEILGWEKQKSPHREFLEAGQKRGRRSDLKLPSRIVRWGGSRILIAIIADLCGSWRAANERPNGARLGFELMFHGNGLTSYRKIHGCDSSPLSATRKDFTVGEESCQGVDENYFSARNFGDLYTKVRFYEIDFGIVKQHWQTFAVIF